MCLPWFWRFCLQTQLAPQPDEDRLHSLTVSCLRARYNADMFGYRWPANDVDLLKFISTCSCVRQEGRNWHARANCACTYTSTSDGCNDADLLICDDLCRCCLFVGGGEVSHFLLIGFLLHLPYHIHTQVVKIVVAEHSLLRTLSTSSSHQQTQQSLHNIPVSCITCALWLGHNCGWEVVWKGVYMHTLLFFTSWEIRFGIWKVLFPYEWTGLQY